MNHVLKAIMIAIILMGLYTGVRYMGAVVHYACEVPLEDCPPPFQALGNLAFYMTGGELVPWWTQK